MKDYRGKKFNMLTAIFRCVNVDKKKERPKYLFLCDCGKSKEIRIDHVVSGITKSCGCSKAGCISNLTKNGINISTKNASEPIFSVIYRYKKSARERNIDYYLSDNFFKKTVLSNCHYCGCTPSQTLVSNLSLDGKITYNGIDRMDNKIGYIESNSVACCKICNRAKREMSYLDFKKYLLSVSNYLNETLCNQDLTK